MLGVHDQCVTLLKVLLPLKCARNSFFVMNFKFFSFQYVKHTKWLSAMQ